MIGARQNCSRKRLVLLLWTQLALATCGGLRPPDATGPRSNQPPYPVLLNADPARLEAAMAQWQRLTQEAQLSDVIEIKLKSQTATIESLPANSSLYLTKLGAGPTMSEEETRESLRRFISEWQVLIGTQPAQLSLVEHADQPNGSKLARYEQHPFRFPLRGGYGILQIRFAPDRRLIDLTSTCIPRSERLQPAIAALTPQLGWEDAANRLTGMAAGYTTATAQQGTYQLSPANRPEVRELVIYVRESADESSLAFNLAWEIAVSNAPFKLVYLDAVNGEIIATV